jgi:hypothetical protein
MRHPIEHLHCIHRQGATRAAVTDSKRSALVWLQRMQAARSKPDGASADPLPARTSTSGAYDAVDRRLMDTFPASDAVARY